MRRKYKSRERTIIKKVKTENINKPCILCNLLIEDESDVSVDHLTSLSRGGETSVENLALAHKDCNEEKGTMNFEEFQNYKLLKDYLRNLDIRKMLKLEEDIIEIMRSMRKEKHEGLKRELGYVLKCFKRVKREKNI